MTDAVVRRGAWVTLAVALTIGACGDAAGPDTDSALEGAWSYRAQQQSPPVLAEGEVVWKRAGHGSAEGTFALVETLAGNSQTRTGTSAAVRQDSVVEFTFLDDESERRHIGVLRGDSISGQWVEFGPLPLPQGSFVLRRRRQ